MVLSKFGHNIRADVSEELQTAVDCELRGDADKAFSHLERAHVLGQASTVQHVRVHWRMLKWGYRQGRFREVLGQVLRIGGAATKTAIGFVPDGNTGGANVSPFKRMPISPDLAARIQKARQS